MATTAKPQKEKSRTGIIIPRQTAASAARAARNALNRNISGSASPSPAAKSPNRPRNRNSLSPQSTSKTSTMNLSNTSSNYSSKSIDKPNNEVSNKDLISALNDFTNESNQENSEFNHLDEPDNKDNIIVVPVDSSTDSPMNTVIRQTTSLEGVVASAAQAEESNDETEVQDAKTNHEFGRDETVEGQNAEHGAPVFDQINNPVNPMDEQYSNPSEAETPCLKTLQCERAQLIGSPQPENSRPETPLPETLEPQSMPFETPQPQIMNSEFPPPQTMLPGTAQSFVIRSETARQETVQVAQLLTMLSVTSNSQTKLAEANQIQTPLESTVSEISRPTTPNKPQTLQTLLSITSRTDRLQTPTMQSETSRPETPQTLRPATPISQTSRPQTAEAQNRAQISTQSSKSRPNTPLSKNNLPKSSPSSRPQTPKQSSVTTSSSHSRPMTPASPSTHKKPPISPRASKPKPLSSSIPVPSGSRNTPHGPSNTLCPMVSEEGDIKSLFQAKRKEFQSMKKELDLKQQAILRTYNTLRNITEQLTTEEASALGAQSIKTGEMMVLNVADWPSQELADLCRDAAASCDDQNALQLIDNLKQIDENTIAELDGKLTNIPSKFSDLCLQAFTARQEVIDWIKQILEQKGDGRNEHLDKIAEYNAQSLQLYEALHIEKTQADNAVSNVTRISKCAFLERGMLIMLGESLVREIAQLRHDLEKKSASVGAAGAQLIRDIKRQLDEERAASATLKEKLVTSEGQLRQTRIRVSKMDRQLREAEASIIHLTDTVKSLEEQNRQRESHFETRARKLKESLRTGEVTNSKIIQQRDMYQEQVRTLTKDLERTVAENKITVNNLQKEVKQLKNALEEKSKEAEAKETLERSLEELRNTVLKETEKNNTLEQTLSQLRSAFEEYKRIHPEGENELPSEREIEMWAELQATKETLRITEEEITACKREKVRFLETLSKISETEDKVEMSRKLAAELMNKEEIICKMQIQIRELTKNVKHNEQKVSQYEQYFRDLQAQKRAEASCQESPNGISYQDLQQEIMNLRLSLVDAAHRNEELSEQLAKKDQQLEQQAKTSRSQARIIKVREELINMLKNKEAEQSKELATLQQDVENRMKIVEEVNKQIASKAEEIQELFTTLENRQQQIHRLEKIVLALEEQQRRAQHQRTRYEEKIAALEHEISAGGHRERKFLFF